MALVGVGMAFLNSGASAVIGDIVSGRKGGPVVAFYQMTSDFGMIIGPLLAGFLLDRTASYHEPFGLSLAIALIVTFFVLTMPETRHRKYAHHSNE